MKRKPRIVVWSKPYCPWCKGLQAMLRDHRFEFEVRDVIAHRHHHEEMVRLTKQSRAPCVEVDGTIHADTSDAELEIWMRDKGYIGGEPA